MKLLPLAVTFGFLGGALGDAAPSPQGAARKVWEMTLSQHIKEPPALRGSVHHRVSAATFSTDEHHLAVSVGQHSVGRESLNHLVVLGVEDPSEGIRQFDYPGWPARTLAWSADGRRIAVPEVDVTIIRLGDGSTCRSHSEAQWQSEGMGGFLQGSLVVGGGYGMESHKYVAPNGHQTTISTYVTSKLLFYGADCKAERSVVIQGRIIAVDTSEAMGGLVVVTFEGGGGAVLDPNGKVIDSWDGGPPGPTRVRFLDGGAAVCVGGMLSHSEPPRCRRVGGPSLTARPKLKCGWPFDTAKRGTLVVAEDLKYSYNWFTEHEKRTPLKTVVYDYRTGRTIVSLPASVQKEHLVDVQWTVPFVHALSPSGRYLVEAGDDVVRLYEIR